MSAKPHQNGYDYRGAYIEVHACPKGFSATIWMADHTRQDHEVTPRASVDEALAACKWWIDRKLAAQSNGRL